MEESKKTKQIPTGLIMLVIIIAVVIVGFAVGIIKPKTQVETKNTISKISLDTYKNNAVELDYRKAMFNEYKVNDLIFFTGKIYQIISDTKIAIFTKGYENWYIDDNVVVSFSEKPKVLEDDIVTIYARYYGIEKYKTLLGETKTIPVLYGDYIEIAGEELTNK